MLQPFLMNYLQPKVRPVMLLMYYTSIELNYRPPYIIIYTWISRLKERKSAKNYEKPTSRSTSRKSEWASCPSMATLSHPTFNSHPMASNKYLSPSLPSEKINNFSAFKPSITTSLTFRDSWGKIFGLKWEGLFLKVSEQMVTQLLVWHTF